MTTLRQFRDQVENIDLKMSRTEWSEYYEDYVSLESTEDWTPKQQKTLETLTRLRPKTVLDIGSNKGWFSKLAVEQGSQVVAFDVDEPSIHSLYQDVSEHNQNILPLVMDFCKPTPCHGPKNVFPPATERLRCEMVLALAVIHHLVFKQNLRLEAIVDSLAQFSTKWLLVEFIPKEDRYVSEWYDDNFNWYHIDGFLAALKGHFRSITSYPSNRAPRTLLLCEK